MVTRLEKHRRFLHSPLDQIAKHRLTDQQIWQLAAYVRSMGRYVRKDVAPSRDDALNSGKGVVANTVDKGQGKVPYDNGTLVADHAYMVTGVDKQGGTVTLHNPWNKDDSGVTLSIADFNKYLSSVDFDPTR